MAFITVAGENQIAAKNGAAQTLNITHFVLAYIAGLGAEPVNRIEAMPAAGNIKATLPVTSSGYVNGNQVVYSLVMDSSLGDYDFNWVGLKDADGVLIACTYTPLIQKRKTTGAIPGNNLTRNFLIAFSGIQATTAIAVPAATWQIDFNARLWGIDERERLSNYDIYGHEAFIGTGWKIQRVGATTTYDVLPGVGYVGGVRIASAVVQPVTVAGPPKSVWVDISLQGDISDVSAVVAFVIDAVAHADYTDANGFHHYVTKIADIAADGSVTDVRVAAESVADHEAKIDPHPQYLTVPEGDARYGSALPLAALDYPTVSTSDNRITVTAAAAINGGTISISANVQIAIAQEIVTGETGIMRTVKTAVFNSADLATNSTYYLRGKFVNGVFTVYTQKGADTDSIPAGLTGTVDGAAGGGFDSTVLDILLAKVVTGAAGSTPTVTALANAKKLVSKFSAASGFNLGSIGLLFTFTLNYARIPRYTPITGIYPPGDSKDTDYQIYVSSLTRYAMNVNSFAWHETGSTWAAPGIDIAAIG